MANTFLISEAALIRRINRRLKQQDERLHKSRPGSRCAFDLGCYYISSTSGGIVQKDVDLGDLGDGLGVLRHYEELDQDDNSVQ